MQPSQFVIPIPVTVLQLDELHEYIDTVLLPDENFEPLYCLYRLISANAFNIHPFEGNVCYLILFPILKYLVQEKKFFLLSLTRFCTGTLICLMPIQPSLS